MATSLTRILRTGLLLIPATALAPFAVAQDQPQPPPTTGQTIGDTRAAIDRWLEVRKTIAKERADWTESKGMMQDRIELLKRDIKKVKEQIAAEREKLTGFETSIEELEATNESLKQSSDAMDAFVASAEARTLTLLAQAPAPLVETVEPLAVQLTGYQAEPDGSRAEPADGGVSQPAAAGARDEKSGDAAETKRPGVPLSRRVENVTGVLLFFNKFSGRVEQASELVEQPDGSLLSVATIYLGLGQGYYVDDAGKTAAVGSADGSAWAWTPNNDAAGVIKKALAVIQKDQPAAFVNLPMEVK